MHLDVPPIIARENAFQHVKTIGEMSFADRQMKAGCWLKYAGQRSKVRYEMGRTMGLALQRSQD